MRLLLLLLVAMLVLAGCGGATRSVSLRVVDLRDGDERPLPGALVRVIPMDAGMVPLPVTGKTLKEATYAKARTIAFTDHDGEVRLDVLSDRAAWIEVERAAIGASAEHADEAMQVWRWKWTPGSSELIADSEDASLWTVGLRALR